jgi:hypothetical protein
LQPASLFCAVAASFYDRKAIDCDTVSLGEGKGEGKR